MTTPETTDADLIAQTREGVARAYAQLWSRHSPAGLAYARTFSRLASADDLVAEAFTRILAVLRAGKGPTSAFRPYLMVVIRNTAMSIAKLRNQEQTKDDFTQFEGAASPESLTLEGADRSTAARAFQSLPTRWQSALWYTEVEQLPREEVADILGLTPNAVSQLTFRARDALRTAWVQAHVEVEALPRRCQDTADLFGGHARGNLSRRDQRRIEGHLQGCERCSEVVGELRPVRSSIPSFSLLVLGGLAGSAALTALTPAASASYAAPLSVSRMWRGLPNAPASVVTAVAGAAAVIIIGAALTSAATGNEPAGTLTATNDAAEAETPRRRPTVPVMPSAVNPQATDPVREVEAGPPSPGGGKEAHAPRMRDEPAPGPSEPDNPRPDAPEDGGGESAPGPDTDGDGDGTPAVKPPSLTSALVADPNGWLRPSIVGTAAPGATVKIFGNGSELTRTVADADGKWRVTDVPAEAGDTTLEITQSLEGVESGKVPAGRVSLKAPEFVVAWNSDTPEIVNVIIERPAEYDVHLSCGPSWETQYRLGGSGTLNLSCPMPATGGLIQVQFLERGTTRVSASNTILVGDLDGA